MTGTPSQPQPRGNSHGGADDYSDSKSEHSREYERESSKIKEKERVKGRHKEKGPSRDYERRSNYERNSHRSGSPSGGRSENRSRSRSRSPSKSKRISGFNMAPPASGRLTGAAAAALAAVTATWTAAAAAAAAAEAAKEEHQCKFFNDRLYKEILERQKNERKFVKYPSVILDPLNWDEPKTYDDDDPIEEMIRSRMESCFADWEDYYSEDSLDEEMGDGYRKMTREEHAEYHKKIEKTKGFDVDVPEGVDGHGIITPFPNWQTMSYLEELEHGSILAITKYNMECGTTFEFKKIVDLRYELCCCLYYITFEATQAGRLPTTFQAIVRNGVAVGPVPEVKLCRIKPESY